MKNLLKMFYCCCILFCSISTINAQEQRNCSSMDNHERLLQEYPAMVEARKQIEKETNKFVEEFNQSTYKNGNILTIPVVVHVVYKANSENISEAQINSQIEVLNQDFRRQNADASNTPSSFTSIAADTEIEFCLASVDPNGQPTNGITRTQTSQNSFDGDAVKSTAQGGKDAWNTSKYLNIWVCNLPGFLGYAQFPGGPANTDGVVVGHKYFGTNGTATAPFNLGRTGTHEVGHWLNLYHIWGDGACGQDDQVSDTPASDAANYGCATGHTSCGSVDMIQNYMDYSDDGCMNLFTNGQKARMLAALNGSRSSLLSSNGCGNGGDGNTSSCSDGVQNGDETGVDCGGSCGDCVSCSDGIQNGDETGVDCGGSCGDCPTPPSSGCDIVNPTNYFTGAALDADCVAAVQVGDTYCCDTGWDYICQEAYDNTCTGDTPEPTNDCAVEPVNYYTGAPLSGYACIETVQEEDSYCCDTDWDRICQKAYNRCIWGYREGSDVPELIEPFDINLYPNPAAANSIIILELDNYTREALSINIVDITGKQVVQLEPTRHNGTIKLNTNDLQLTQGLYIVQVKNGESEKHLKLIVK